MTKRTKVLYRPNLSLAQGKQLSLFPVEPAVFLPATQAVLKPEPFVPAPIERFGQWEGLADLNVTLYAPKAPLTSMATESAFSDLTSLCALLPACDAKQRDAIQAQLTLFDTARQSDVKGVWTRSVASSFGTKQLKDQLSGLVKGLYSHLKLRSSPELLLRAVSQTANEVKDFSELRHYLDAALPVIQCRVAYEHAATQLTQHRWELTDETRKQYQTLCKAYKAQPFGEHYWNLFEEDYPKALVKAFLRDLESGADPKQLPKESPLGEVIEAAWCARLTNKIRKNHKQQLGFAMGD